MCDDGDVEEQRFSTTQLMRLIEMKKKKRFLNACVVIGEHQFYKTIYLAMLNVNEDHPIARSQLLYRNRDSQHWTAVDIEISFLKKVISIYAIDAAADLRNYLKIREILFTLISDEHHYCIELTSTAGGLQKDHHSCSIFSLDHVFHFGKVADLHAYLGLYREIVPVRTQDALNARYQRYQLAAEKLPPVLVKNAQSLRFLHEYCTLHPEASHSVMNAKGQTLITYVAAHSRFFTNVLQNKAIEDKYEHYLKKLMR